MKQTNDLLQIFMDAFGAHKASLQGKYLVTASGGLDSTVLARLCQMAGIDFAIAHCNFQLRGTESERDELFVIALAEELKVPIYFKKFETQAYADEQRLSIQEAARNLRYQWFSEIKTTIWIR